MVRKNHIKDHRDICKNDNESEKKIPIPNPSKVPETNSKKKYQVLRTDEDEMAMLVGFLLVSKL